MSVIVAGAMVRPDEFREALNRLALPQLQRWLSRARQVEHGHVPPDAGCAAHEMALATGAGAAAGTAPAGDAGRAAWECQQTQQACAWVSPCHWQIGMHDAFIVHPDLLAITEPQSRELLGEMQPLFASEGIELAYVSPTHWLATGAPLQQVSTTSMDAACGRALQACLPAGAGGGALRRMMSEAQMLLYHHPVNDQRHGLGQLPLNSVWVHGAGRWTGPPARADGAPVQVKRDLLAAVWTSDTAQWSAQWQALDADLRTWLPDSTQSLVLCGQRSYRAFAADAAPWSSRLARAIGLARPDLAALLAEAD